MDDNQIKRAITKNIGNAVKYSHKAKNKIAEETGISKPTLSQYLSGRSLPSLVTFIRLCKSLDCSYEDILGNSAGGNTDLP